MNLRVRTRQFFAVARLTALEAVRLPTALLLILSIVGLSSLLPVLIAHKIGEGVRLVRDSALALQWVGGLLLAGFLAVSTLRRELGRGTAAGILVKPMPRALYFAAKYIGVLAPLLLYAWICGLATLLLTRAAAENYLLDWWGAAPLWLALPAALIPAALINYFTRRPYPSTALLLLALTLPLAVAVSAIGGGDPAALPWALAPTILLNAVSLAVLAALALSLAVRAEAGATLAGLGFLFLLGLVSDYMVGRHLAELPWLWPLYALIPNWQLFWTADALAVGAGIPWSYVGAVSLYAVLYLAGALSWGMVSLRNLEMN
ncbi:MAG: hypothetical protein K9N49_09360 [Candidatus Marinimicrobia bacterium]|nr:hypothetical protein [Candidatus Neomarinimicrobiota bacterium]